MYHQGQTHRPAKAGRSARHNLVGHGSAGRPLPAWKPNVRNQAPPTRAVQSPQFAQINNSTANGASHHTNISEPGSKVYIQGLPKDVTASDVHDLLVGQIGPLKDCYIVHNASGFPKGCAFVHFQRARDGVNACKTFDGKKIDNDNSIRVQLITDPPPIPIAPPKQRSLIERLGEIANGPAALPVTSRAPMSLPARVQPPTPLNAPIAPKGKMRKGPRRAKAQQARIQGAPAAQQSQRPKVKTAQDLDAEMEQYRQQGQGRLGLL